MFEKLMLPKLILNIPNPLKLTFFWDLRFFARNNKEFGEN